MQSCLFCLRQKNQVIPNPVKKPDLLSKLPEVILKTEILSKLDYKTLSQLSCVSKKWTRLTSTNCLWEPIYRTLSAKIPEVIDLDEIKATCAINKELAPPMYKQKVLALIAGKNLAKNSLDNQAYIATLPKGWSFQDLSSFLKVVSTHCGSIQLEKKFESHEWTFKNLEISNTKIYVISGDLLKNTLNKSFPDIQKTLKKEYMEIPELLVWMSITALAKIFFFKVRPQLSFTYCQEKTAGMIHYLIGESSTGYKISTQSTYPAIWCLGSAAQVRISPIHHWINFK